MISEKQARKYCCEPIENIENYQEAVADTTQTWICHHRGEILPCGNYHQWELKKFGLFKNRPACELVFLSPGEHSTIHNLNRPKDTIEKIFTNLPRGENHPMYGKHHTDEWKANMSIRQSGENHWNYGRHRPEETRRKLSEAQKGEKNHNWGKQKSDETKAKMAISQPNKVEVSAFKNGVLVGTYISLREAAKKLGCSDSNICKVLQGKYSHTNGYTFQRKTSP